MKILHFIICIGLFLQTSTALTDTTASAENRLSVPSSVTPQPAWLGVSARHVPMVLRDQLAKLIPANQGLLITSVSPESPADRAGLKQNDVLLSYDNQKLYSPAQLFNLVRSDQAERSVEVQVIQQSQLKTLQVQLDKFEQWSAQPYSPFNHQAFSQRIPPLYDFRLNEFFNNNSMARDSMAWDSFESVQVNTLPDGRYRAEVSFKNNDNKTQTFTFEGEREVIIEQINNQSDLPLDKKNSLLNALQMNPDPFFNHPFFNRPFFQQHPFNSRFFKKPAAKQPFLRERTFNAPPARYSNRPSLRHDYFTGPYVNQPAPNPPYTAQPYANQFGTHPYYLNH